MTYNIAGSTFELKQHLPIEEAFLVAVDTVNHYMIEDAAAGELYAHPLLKEAWTTQLFFQYYTSLGLHAFEEDGRQPLYALLQWTKENAVLYADETLRTAFESFRAMVEAVEATMLHRYRQRYSAGNQLRKLINRLELRDDAGNGGADVLREIVADHMLREKPDDKSTRPTEAWLFDKLT